MCRYCHIRSVEIGVEYWIFCQILNLCFLPSKLSRYLKLKRDTASKLIESDLKTFELLSWARPTRKAWKSFQWFVFLLDLIFFSWKLKRKQRFEIQQQQFQYATPISTLQCIVINKMIRTLVMFEKIVSWNCNKLQKNMSPWNNCKILFRLTIKNHFNVKLLNCNYSSLYNYTTFQIPGNSSSFPRTIQKYEVKISMKLYFKLYS